MQVCQRVKANHHHTTRFKLVTLWGVGVQFQSNQERLALLLLHPSAAGALVGWCHAMFGQALQYVPMPHKSCMAVDFCTARPICRGVFSVAADLILTTCTD